MSPEPAHVKSWHPEADSACSLKGNWSHARSYTATVGDGIAFIVRTRVQSRFDQRREFHALSFHHSFIIGGQRNDPCCNCSLVIKPPVNRGRFGGGRMTISNLIWKREPATSQSPDFSALLGGWRLLSSGSTLTDTKERIEQRAESRKAHGARSIRSDHVSFHETRPTATCE